jgi:hypothetical protein
MQTFVAKGLYELAIYQYVKVGEQGRLPWILQDAFKIISCVTPNVFTAFPADFSCQFAEAFGLHQGIPSAESYISKWVV